MKNVIEGLGKWQERFTPPPFSLHMSIFHATYYADKLTAFYLCSFGLCPAHPFTLFLSSSKSFLSLFVSLCLTPLLPFSVLPSSDRWLTLCLVQQLSLIISSHPNEHLFWQKPLANHTQIYRQIHAHTCGSATSPRLIRQLTGGTNYLKLHQ